MRPAPAHRAPTFSTALRSPETTTADGPLTAAIDTLSSSPASDSRTSFSPAWIAIMAPSAVIRCMSPALAVISVAASGSVSTPETCAATISPTECPMR